MYPWGIVEGNHSKLCALKIFTACLVDQSTLSLYPYINHFFKLVEDPVCTQNCMEIIYNTLLHMSILFRYCDLLRYYLPLFHISIHLYVSFVDNCEHFDFV